MRIVLKGAALTVAVLFLVGAMLTAVVELFAGSKVRPLFGMSADALAGETQVEKRSKVKKLSEFAADAGAPVDAGSPIEAAVLDDDPTYFDASKSGLVRPRRKRDAGAPTFFPASKSLAGEALPGLDPAPNPAPNPPPRQNASPQQVAP